MKKKIVFTSLLILMLLAMTWTWHTSREGTPSADSLEPSAGMPNREQTGTAEIARQTVSGDSLSSALPTDNALKDKKSQPAGAMP